MEEYLLDGEFIIRSFNPAVTFNLISTDRRAPLTNIISHVETGDLPADVRMVLERANNGTQRRAFPTGRAISDIRRGSFAVINSFAAKSESFGTNRESQNSLPAPAEM